MYRFLDDTPKPRGKIIADEAGAEMKDVTDTVD